MLVICVICTFWAAGDALAAGETRTIHTRHLDLHYDFPGYATQKAWEAHAAFLRRHILVSTGLWPTPERCEPDPQVFGRIEREGYSVEKAFFQSYPGFFVTGNLYRPLGRPGPFPGVISPHGHWGVGRLANEELGSVPGRCINLARQGHVVFTYDMVGYNDSKQVTHQFAGARQELWGQSLLALQLWNSIRAIDFLQTLPDVDPERIGCTGASGGGTQTFMVMAVDDRVKAAAPVNMVSAYMQGGCLCENAPNLRVDTYNTEIAATMAPRPLLLVSATGDWTSHNPTEEALDIRSIYELYGAADRFHCVQFDAPHNYNLDSREAVYAWFGKWLLGIDDAEALREQPFEVETNEDLLVFAGRDLPPNALDEHGLVQYLIEASERQLEAHRPVDRITFRGFREVYGSALAHSLNLSAVEPEEVEASTTGPAGAAPYAGEHRLLRWRDAVVPVTLLQHGRRAPLVVLISDTPRATLLNSGAGQPAPLVRRLFDAGRDVMLVDCFLVGDNQLSPESDRNPEMKFFTTYNRTDTALRVQDVVIALAYARQAAGRAKASLVGIGEGGLWCLLASATSPQAAAVVADMAGLDPASDEEFIARLATPGLRRAGDLRTAGALWAPARLLVHNMGSDAAAGFIEAAYVAAEVPRKVRLEQARLGEDDIIGWLTAD